MCSARRASRPGRAPAQTGKALRRRVVFACAFYSCHGGAAPELVVLSGTLPARTRVGPGLITVSWMPCECGPAVAAREHGPGYVVVYCEAVKGCRSAWYSPRHEPPA